MEPVGQVLSKHYTEKNLIIHQIQCRQNRMDCLSILVGILRPCFCQSCAIHSSSHPSLQECMQEQQENRATVRRERCERW